jgi:hypothetical protein
MRGVPADHIPVTPIRVVLTLVLLALAAPAAARGEAYAPPNGKVLNGLTAGYEFGDFTRRAGKAPAVWQHFVSWNGSLDYTIDNTRRAGARLMYHLGTAGGQNMPERISPGEIARGKGDGYLIRLTRAIAGYGQPAYIRLMGEMNNCDNAYASHSCTGARRDADHSPATFKKAWKRVHVIMHGGDIADVNAKLAARGLPAVQAGADRIPEPQIAFVWAPMVGGSPNIAALAPGRFWPGRRWVDWVGTSFYSRFPNWTGLNTFYRSWAVGKRKPFAIAEWAMWGADTPSFASQLFDWIASHRRTKMIQYNQGRPSPGTFRLANYPASARVIKRRLAAKRYLSKAP